MLQCARCKKVNYCSNLFQTRAWKAGRRQGGRGMKMAGDRIASSPYISRRPAAGPGQDEPKIGSWGLHDSSVR